MKCPFDLTNKNQVIEFEERDPYNPQNTVKGYINRRQGSLYGSLYITHVNKKKCPQLIYSAPKQHYPFDKERNWQFPECNYIQLYEKLDGTCIVGYSYRDIDMHDYFTFKTRLRPFLGSSKFGNFFELWNEMLRKYPEILEIQREYHNYVFVFELYGKRNKILIDYDIPLDTKLIFGINDKGFIYSPKLLQEVHSFRTKGVSGINTGLDLTGIPILEKEDSTKDFDGNEIHYIDKQNELESNLQIDEENKIMKGKEGLVWYFIKDGHAVQIKCKPPSVLKYHWSGDAIAYESIYTTVINAFENFDEPTFDNVKELLLEEFDEGKIEKSQVRINKILGKTLFDKRFQYTLSEDYNKLGVDINKDKATVMRWFGKHYPKSESKRIYNLLKQYEEEKTG